MLMMSLGLAHAAFASDIEPDLGDCKFDWVNIAARKAACEAILADGEDPRRTARAHFVLAQYFEYSSSSLAIDETSKAIALDPGFVDAYWFRSMLREGRNQNSAALEDIEHVVGSAPSQRERQRRADVRLRAADFDGAIRDLDVLVGDDFDGAESSRFGNLLSRALAKQYLGRMPEAFGDLDQIDLLFPYMRRDGSANDARYRSHNRTWFETVDPRRSTGNASEQCTNGFANLLRSGQGPSSIPADCTRAFLDSSIAEDKARFLLNRAIIAYLWDVGYPYLNRTDLNVALTLNPDDRRAQLWDVFIQFWQGSPDRRLFETLGQIQDGNRDPFVLSMRALLLGHRCLFERLTPARMNKTDASQESGADDELMAERYLACDATAARATAFEALALEPGYPIALLAIGFVEEYEGNPKAALAYGRAAFDTSRGCAFIHDWTRRNMERLRDLPRPFDRFFTNPFARQHPSCPFT